MSSPRDYGTLPASNPEDGFGAGEQMPLLRKPSSPPLLARFRQFMMVNVKREKADIILVLCYLVTGLLDSASISIWGSFVSMQTGEITPYTPWAIPSPPPVGVCAPCPQD